MTLKVKRSKYDINSLLFEIKNILNGLYGGRLVDVILYGSFARDDATEDSDIDIAVVFKGDVNKFDELDRLHDAVYPLALKYGELVSFHPVSEDELSDTEWALHSYIHKEGVKV